MTPKSLIEPARHAGTALLRSQTDARLVDLTRDGNERAFEAIVHRYRRPLLRYCSRILSPTRAEDAVQQAFLSAHRSIHAGDAELNLRPWLYRIAHNSALNLLRQTGFDHEEMSEEIDGVETPPQVFELGERLRSVVAAVKDLPERQRDAIVLQAMEGRSYDEIAAELGVSDGAVRQLLNRARNTLREAAAALTPTGLVTRIAASGGDASVVERVAQVVSGAGGGALLVKAGATLVVAGAVAGGAVTGTLPVPGVHRAVTKAVADPPAGAARAPVVNGADRRAPGVSMNVRTLANRGAGGASPTRPHGPRGARGGRGTSSPIAGAPSGAAPSAGGGGDRSGSGSSGSGDAGRSGSDGGGDHSGSGSSGSGDGGSVSSGSGPSGSSGPGDGGSGTSGTSGTSGSGDGGHSGSDGGGDHSGSGSSGSGQTLLSSPSSSGSDGSGSGGSTDGHSGPGG